MPVSGLIEGSKHLAYLALLVVVGILCFYVGGKGQPEVRTLTDTLYVDRPADFDRDGAAPDVVTIFDTTAVTVTDTITIRVPERLRTGLSVVGQGSIQVDRPLLSAPRVRLLRYDVEQQRGVEEAFQLRPPPIRISGYIGAHRNFAPDEQFGIHIGGEIRHSRLSAFGEIASDPYLRVGLRYYLTSY